jgi:hypothetical protein
VIGTDESPMYVLSAFAFAPAATISDANQWSASVRVNSVLYYCGRCLARDGPGTTPRYLGI